jgi:hypothetical protein
MEIYSSYIMQLLLKLTVLLPRPYVTIDDVDAICKTFEYHTVRKIAITTERKITQNDFTETKICLIAPSIFSSVSSKDI